MGFSDCPEYFSKTGKALVFLLLFQMPGFALPAFQWPASTKKISSTFGESRMERFHNGLDLAGRMDLHSPADAEILHSRTEADDPFAPIPGPGNYLFLQHDEGWVSGHYHLEEIDRRYGPVERGEKIGRTPWNSCRMCPMTARPRSETCTDFRQTGNKCVCGAFWKWTGRCRFWWRSMIPDRAPPGEACTNWNGG